MRKIKYKAWDNDLELMADVLAIDWTENGDIASLHLKYEEKFTNRIDDDLIRKVYPEKDYGDNITLLQFTGLKDNKNIEIYEGHIISTKGYFDGYKYNTCGYDYDFVAEVKWNDIELTYTCNDCNLSDLTNFEIIGHIYQNPELLKSRMGI